MPFETFDKRSMPITTSPFVTIQKRGPLSLNRQAYMELGEPEAVTLMFDRDEQLIGIKPISSKEPQAFLIRPQGAGERTSNYVVAGHAFTKHYGINTEVARRYSAEMQGDTLVVDLKQGGMVATGPRDKNYQRNKDEYGRFAPTK